jgi:osmotically inducible protein OsmC
MPEQKRQTSVTWRGDLDDGQGLITSSSSSALKDLSFSRASRVELATTGTSPEELLAGAHAQCYVMGLAHVLSNMGTPPEQLTVQAECSLETTQRGPKITKMLLTVSGCVPHLDQATFEQAARKAEAICPISRVLREGLEIALQATLEHPVGA